MLHFKCLLISADSPGLETINPLIMSKGLNNDKRIKFRPGEFTYILVPVNE